MLYKHIKLVTTLLFFLIYTYSLFSQSLSKLMESIKNYDYYHTKKYAYKMLKHKKKTSAAAYALSYVFYQKYQPFHNIDSADIFIHLAILNYPHKPFVSKYGKIDSNAIYSLYDSIVVEQFRKINSTTFPKVYDLFISHHPFMSKQTKEMIKIHQYQKITEYVQKINKSDTTFQYITQYSENPHIAQLHNIFDNQIYNELTAHQTAAEYILFLRNYPKNINREKALQALLDIYIKEKNTAGLKSFAQEFVNDKFYSAQAWKWLFTYSVKKFNNEELEKFIQEHPDFPFKTEILEEMEMNTKILLPFADTLGNIGFIDTSGKFVIPPIYDAVTPFRENISVVFKNDSAFFINKYHQKVVSKSFKDAYPFYNGYAPVYDNQEWFFINRLGVKQSESFEWISEISYDNNYVFKKNNLYGLCDYKGQIILPPVFEKLGDFENHRAYYVENNLYGIVWDNSKKYPAKYQWISTFYENIAIVKQNNLYGLINDNNEIVLNAEYDLIFHCNEDIYMVIKNKKYGFFNSKKLCFEYFIQYDYIKNTDPKTYYHENYFKLMLQNKAFLGNSNGMAVNKKPFQDIILSKDFIFIKNNNQWKILYANNNLSTYNFNYFSICNNQTIIAQVSDHFVIIDKAANIKYKTKNKLSYIYKNYYFEQIDDEKGIIIDTTGKLIYSDVENYKVFEKYLIVTKPDKTVKVIE